MSDVPSTLRAGNEVVVREISALEATVMIHEKFSLAGLGGQVSARVLMRS